MDILTKRRYLLLTVFLLSLSSITAFPITIMLPKLVLLDRDGVINEDVGAPGVTCKTQFQLTPNAATAIGRLKRQGCHVVVVTNQSCVGKGIITNDELTEIHNHMKELLSNEDKDAVLNKIYVCTSNDDADPRKKPNPGMMLEAMKDYNTVDCVLIGDTLTDLQAAAAANVPLRVLVSTGYGQGIMGREANEVETVTQSPSLPQSILPFYYVKNLASAVDWLLGL